MNVSKPAIDTRIGKRATILIILNLVLPLVEADAVLDKEEIFVIVERWS